jgi:hypothetical protein
MKTDLIALLMLTPAGNAWARAINTQAFAARGPGQWVLDVIWQRREFAGGRLQPPEPELRPAIPHQREIYVLGRVP